MDDRLSHDRKTVFHRTVQQLKSKFGIEVFSSSITEDALLQELEKSKYGLVLLPWYHYLQWKRVEAFFGTYRLQGTTVAGYFADALLPFEFSTIPNYQRFILLDFYRWESADIEWILRSLLTTRTHSGLAGLCTRTTPVYVDEWFDDAASAPRSIENCLKLPIVQNTTFGPRTSSIRLYLTSLWSMCFEGRHALPSQTPAATFEVAEIQQKLVIKLLFETSEHTLQRMMGALWPAATGSTASLFSPLKEMSRQVDYLRVQQFPESQQVEITGIFFPQAPVLQFPNELRGWWIEPLQKQFAKTTETEVFLKRIPLSASGTHDVRSNLDQSAEALRVALLQLTHLSPEERAAFDHRLSNIKFLVQEIDKKVVKKKTA